MYIDPNPLHLGPDNIPALSWRQRYKYLGCPVGAGSSQDLSAIRGPLLRDCEAIMMSQLAEWQKIDAFRRFLFPRLSYAFKVFFPGSSWCRKLNTSMRKWIKKDVSLPARACSSIYTPQALGGLGIPRCKDEMHIARAAQAFKFLADTRDPTIRAIAIQQLESVGGPGCLPQHTCSIPGRSQGRRKESLEFSESKSAIYQLLHSPDSASILSNGSEISWRKRDRINQSLKEATLGRHLTELLQAPDQGRASFSTCLAAASNYFTYSGAYLTFAQYRFALRARLNLLPTATSRSQIKQNWVTNFLGIYTGDKDASDQDLLVVELYLYQQVVAEECMKAAVERVKESPHHATSGEMESFTAEQKEYLERQFSQLTAAMVRPTTTDQAAASGSLADVPAQGDNGDDQTRPTEPRQPTTGLSLPVFTPVGTVPTLGGVMAPAVLDGPPRLGEPCYPGGSGQLGAGLAARFPPKVVAKIENLEFVEMSDLLQEAWTSDTTDPANLSILKHFGRRPPVSDILVWAECFTAMASVLSRKYPLKAPELFAYARRIFNAARIYESHAWVTYDRIYRCQAATRRSLDWSMEEKSLYNEAFAGRARQSTRDASGSVTCITGVTYDGANSAGVCPEQVTSPPATGHAQWYTQDLLNLKQMSVSVAADGVSQLITDCSTPLRVGEWEAALTRHPDQRFASLIIEGLRHGFRIGFGGGFPLASSPCNMPSAAEQVAAVDKYVEGEFAARRFVGPYDPASCPNVHINRIGAVPKGHTPGKWRIITDLSFPAKRSVNDGIDPALCSLSYVSVDQVAAVAAKLGRGAILAKVDIESAYCLVPIEPRDRPLMGIRWKEKIYCDCMLPFGLRSAPKLFTAVADALEWVIREQGGVTNIAHYLDDFIVLGRPESDECARCLRVLMQTCDRLGVPLAPGKSEGPSTTLTFLGIKIDTVACTLALPQPKLQRVRDLLLEWGDKKACTRRELESLIGLLNHVCKVRPGRSFLRRMIDLLSASKASFARKPLHRIRLNREFRSDLAWWRTFILDWNGVGYMVGPDPLVHGRVAIATDASGSWGSSVRVQSNLLHLPGTGCRPIPPTAAYATGGSVTQSRTGVALDDLEGSVQLFFRQGLAESTHRTYGSGMRCFHDFCVRFSVSSPFPISEKLLCYFSVFLADEKLSFPTTKTYLAAVRDAHISLGFPDPRSAGSMPRLERIQAGIRRVQALKGPSKRIRLPITLTILERLGSCWLTGADGQVYWAVATLCFFGFFRLWELLPSDAASPPNISWGDMTFDHASEPSVMKIHLRTSKCDQYGKGADVFVGKTGNTLCPIAACLAYLALRGTTDPGAFFLKPDKRPLLKPSMWPSCERRWEPCDICGDHPTACTAIVIVRCFLTKLANY
eukprot:Em0007g1183a